MFLRNKLINKLKNVGSLNIFKQTCASFISYSNSKSFIKKSFNDQPMSITGDVIVFSKERFGLCFINDYILKHVNNYLKSDYLVNSFCPRQVIEWETRGEIIFV